ncbi:DUF58 domain-containing protein [Catalinimonas sp. 4WD22]|uniref:DUF58 domain-containing protein n=1 Tax=Catalinimonas locisalis TaxID=3133978 RepID=UPI003100E054
MLRTTYLTHRFFFGLAVVVLLFVLSFSFSWLFRVAQVCFLVWLLLIIADILLLYNIKKGISGYRLTPDRLSNGDENVLKVEITNHYSFKTHLRIIDEIPVQFQKRDFDIRLDLASAKSHSLTYTLRPVKRGEYGFGALNIYAASPIHLLLRRFRFSQDKVVSVYPSFIQMRKYELMAISSHLTELGIKRIRRFGHNREFEQIKEYVAGDDFRTINWKATARRGDLMVNKYQDERSQQVYALIDKGRTMKMPFEEMSLLDYAINASLVISNIAIKKEDKAGLITFQHKVQQMVPAGKRSNQMHLIMEALYAQKTAYKESNFEALYVQVKRQIRQRSLLLLFTNFESLSSLERQLPYLRRLAATHVLVVIFFKNTELYKLLQKEVQSIQDVYQKTVAEKFALEKKVMADTLQKHGIYSVLTTSSQLSVDTINKYLELKARGVI